jgi:archaellum component FlaC
MVPPFIRGNMTLKKCLSASSIPPSILIHIKKWILAVATLPTFLPSTTTLDRMVHQRCKKKLNEVNKSREKLDRPQQIVPDIDETRDKIGEKEKLILEHNTDDLLPLYENRFDEEWRIFEWRDEQTMEFPEQDYTIVRKNVIQEGISTVFEFGGQDSRHWYVRFKRNIYKKGKYHVTLSTSSRIKYRKDIEKWKSELNGLKKELKSQTKEYEALGAIASLEAKNLTMKQSMYTMMAKHTEAEFLALGDFMELVEAGIYQGSDVEGSADELERHLEKKYGVV